MPEFYTIPQIRRFKNKWYVEYYFKNPLYLLEESEREFTRFKVYEGINRYSGVEQENYATRLRKVIEDNLREGYNPFKEKASKVVAFAKANWEREEREKEKLKGDNITNLIDLYLEERKAKGLKSAKAYNIAIKHFKEWLAYKGWENRGVKEFTTKDLYGFLRDRQKLHGWGGTTYNGIRDHLFIWFNWFKLEEYIIVNPCNKKIPKQRKDSTKNEYFHGDLLLKVKEELKKDPLLELACMIVFFAAVRSYAELSQIKIEDIDLENRVLKIKESVGKTGYRFIPICDELAEIFNGMELDKYPRNYYIIGNRGKITDKRLSKDYLSLRFKSIKDKLGLGKEYGIYSFKHTRIVSLKNAGYKDAEIQDLTGHTSSEGYNAYTRNFGLSLNTKLKGKTLEF